MDLWAEFLERIITPDTEDGDLNGLLRDWATNPANTMYNPGVGTYSVTEILHLAGLNYSFDLSVHVIDTIHPGLPIDLTMAELLRSPSRLCRYLLALYQFLHEGRFRVWYV